MTPQHRFIDRDDLIKFLKFAGFDIELTERTDTVEELAISGFDDTGDVYYFELSHPAPSPETKQPKCDDCLFRFQCTLLYFPPCERMARQDEQQAAAKAREKVLDEILHLIDEHTLNNRDNPTAPMNKSILRKDIESLRTEGGYPR